ncbi:WD40 repeat containing protein [Gracilaria domingensis]|nr:WD40 repeat containing protein [Gracilaria domingensis]
MQGLTDHSSGPISQPVSQAIFKASQNVDSIAVLQDTEKTEIESDECLRATSVSQYVVIGTYVHKNRTDGQNGDSSTSTRRGSAVLLEATRRHPGDSLCSFHLTKRDETALPAVLDVQSCKSLRTVYAACSQNKLYALSCSEKADHLDAKAVNKPQDNLETMILSLDLYDKEGERLIATSDSKGAVALYNLSATGDAKEVFQRNAHSLEAWTACVSRSVACSAERTMVYSGGDDGVLCAWRADTDRSIFRRRNAHDGVGVTTIATRLGHEHELWTGGYNDTVRIWDVRSLRRCVEERNVGGGVWRLRFHPRHSEYVLVAAMYDGCKALRLVDGSHLQVVAEFEAHESIAYGASWLSSLDSEHELVAITGSFYDCAVHIWSIDKSKGLEGTDCS